MKTNTLIFLLQIAGLMHIGLIAAGLLMPRVVNLRANLAVLPNFIRRLYWVYYAFIGLCLVGFGSISFVLAKELAAGAPLARVMCAFFALFWTLRLVAATFIFDVRPYLTTGFLRLGYHATNVAFAYLPLAYALAAWKGGAK
ncbi:MAG TPA: hypothetical protein VH619_16910 [Verrucomicrobiae bacterium]|jgi:hypothetical protein|nr:hypothetical protein [Verrucomicrobiae bacterium]